MCRRPSALAAAFLTLILCPGSAAFGSTQETPEPATLEAEGLGVSLARIKQKLDRLPDSEEERSLLRLNFYVEVYGRAPQLDYFRGFDIHNSPVPYGVPVNTELLAVMRAGEPQLVPPAINVNQVLGWVWQIGR